MSNELEVLVKAEEARFFTDKALLKAIGSGETLPWVDYVILDVAQRDAYPPEELEEHTDPDTLRYPYHLERREHGPVDWWHGARFMVVGFMRRAHEAGAVELLKDLELVRERATVQQLLAERDLDRRLARTSKTRRHWRSLAGTLFGGPGFFVVPPCEIMRRRTVTRASCRDRFAGERVTTTCS